MLNENIGIPERLLEDENNSGYEGTIIRVVLDTFIIIRYLRGSIELKDNEGLNLVPSQYELLAASSTKLQFKLSTLIEKKKDINCIFTVIQQINNFIEDLDSIELMSNKNIDE